jgi:hypothetical protein
MSAKTKRALREFRAPDEGAAGGRAWGVVHSAYLEREPVRRPRTHWRLTVAPIAAVIVAGLVLSPAGASVGRFITKALGVRHAAPMLSSLPSAGRVLVSGPGGTWTAAADGSLRRLGNWSQANWSPHGLYLAVASRDRLAAVDPKGNIHWAIARRGVSDPTWFSPTGYRIAYLSAGTLRVIAGDGTADRLLASGVAGVAPAWRPGYSFQVAYVTTANRLVVRDSDTRLLIWSRPLATTPRQLLWSADGRRLVVVSAHAVRTYTGSGALRATLHLTGAPTGDAALSPDGSQVALVRGGDQLVVVGAGSSHAAMRQLLAGSGLHEVSWSPNGSWLLVAWPAADQWVFVRAVGAPRVDAVARIAQQFSAGGSSAKAFPRLEGWCCTAFGPAG